jgi:ADP-ribose pyrophosphatase
MHDAEQLLLSTSRFQVVRRTYRDRQGRERVRDSIQHPGAVTILPWLDGQRVCLIRNVRPAVGQTLIELPAGTLEPGEDPAVTASRELVEETGYRAGRLELLAQFFMSPGILNERMWVFVARDLTAGAAELEPGEEIEPLVVPWEEALRMADQGEIQDAKTLVGLYAWDRRWRAEQ